MDSLRGPSVKIGAMQRRLAWPLRKDDTHKSRLKQIYYIMLYKGHHLGDARPAGLQALGPDSRGRGRLGGAHGAPKRITINK